MVNKVILFDFFSPWFCLHADQVVGSWESVGCGPKRRVAAPLCLEFPLLGFSGLSPLGCVILFDRVAVTWLVPNVFGQLSRGGTVNINS